MTCSTACHLTLCWRSGNSLKNWAVRESMVFLDGRAFTGDPPGLRTIQRGSLMLVYLTDVRGERVVVIQVNWLG